MSKTAREAYRGPVLFSYGFRPFFLLALGFAVLVIPLWMAVYLGHTNLQGPFGPVDWHIHEMLFGYTAAVLCGFLFTAIPNWTGRMPVRGWPLIVMVALWIAGRLVMAGVGGLGAFMVMGIDSLFLAAVVGMIVIEVVAGRNWRNLKVIVPVVLFLAANILFHIEVIMSGAADYGRRLSVAVVIFLITLIGGRIIPSFTRNWLAKSNPGSLPIPFNRFDALCLVVGATALIIWVAWPEVLLSNMLLLFTSAIHFARLLRWCGYRTLGSPLLLILHLAYGFIPLGLLFMGLGDQTAGLHLLGIGAIGGMTVAVMVRATLGHTGRRLQIGSSLKMAFTLLIMAALIRSSSSFVMAPNLTGLVISAVLWVLCFSIILVLVGPWLLTVNTKRRMPNKQT